MFTILFVLDLDQTEQTSTPVKCLFSREDNNQPEAVTGTVTLEVTRQGRQVLWPQEREALGASEGHVREVVLLIDGRPAVWARSVTPLSAVKGPWQAMKGLGTRPLAELLFAHRRVHRGFGRTFQVAQAFASMTALQNAQVALEAARSPLSVGAALWRRHVDAAHALLAHRRPDHHRLNRPRRTLPP